MKVLLPNRWIKLCGGKVNIGLLPTLLKTRMLEFTCRPSKLYGYLLPSRELEYHREEWRRKYVMVIGISGKLRRNIRQFRITLWHENLHLLLNEIGVSDQSEVEIDAMSKKLARDFPQITEVFEEAFPGLSLKTPFKKQSVRYDLRSRTFKLQR